MEIRTAGVGDVEALVRLRLDFYEDIGYDLQGDTELADALRAYYTRALADGSFAAWLAEDGGEAVSTVFVVFHNTLPGRRLRGGRQGTVLNVFTYPAHRGKGYAKALMEQAIRFAGGQGVELLDLFATEMGERVYRPLGFDNGLPDLYMTMDPRSGE